MKKILLFFLLVTMHLTQALAEEVGYTTGHYSRSSFFSLGTGARQGLAIRLSRQKLALLKGRKITGLKAIYGTKNLEKGKVTAFVSTQLEGTPLVSCDQPLTSANIPTTSAKWTETTFDTPYTITGEEECLYIGYVGELKGDYKLYSTDGTMDAAGCTYALINDSWTDLNGKNRGMAQVKAVVDGLPQYCDVLMKTTPLGGYYLAGNTYTLQGEVFNAGTETIQTMDVAVVSDKTQTLHLDNLNLLPGQTLALTLPEVTAQTSGSTDLRLEVTQLNGAKDADPSDNSYAENVFFYPSDMERVMLVETFTGQKCSNCPSGHATLKRVLADIKENMVEVSHHAGYYPDYFTMNEDLQYTLFYGSSSTYAPAFMVNRYPNASTYIPVQEISEQNITGMFSQLASSHPYASLRLATEYNEQTREVKLKFQVYGHEDMGQTQNVLNVMMIQDGMIDIQSNGGSNYEHNHVFRSVVTDNAWGLLSDFKPGEVVTFEKTFTLPESLRSSYWTDAALEDAGTAPEKVTKAVDPSKVSFVGYIARYVPNDATLNYVYNCVQTKLGESYTQRAFAGESDGVEETRESEAPDFRIEGGRIYADSATGIYDTMGHQYARGSRLAPGTYVVKGKKGVREIVVK